MNLLRDYTELVEPVSIDEGYLDITDCSFLGSPIEIAKSIQKRLLETLDLPCSIGIAPNKFLAKTASDMKKPMGITILRKRDVQGETLATSMLVKCTGLVKKRLKNLMYRIFIQLAILLQANDVSLKNLLGINGLRLKERANGIDSRPVDPESIFDYKSIGNSTTLPRIQRIKKN